MKGRIFSFARYKAWNEGIVTSRVNPHNTSRECARCHAPIIRYAYGEPEEGYTVGAPLMLCRACELRGHADRNASVVIGQRLMTRYQQEKPYTPLVLERSAKAEGVVVSQDAKSKKEPSLLIARRGDENGYGTTQEKVRMDGCVLSAFPPPLR
jgi:hypothetical protein